MGSKIEVGHFGGHPVVVTIPLFTDHSHPHAQSLSIVYKCYGHLPKIVRVFPASAEEKLRALENVVYCCAPTCCYE